MVQSLRLGILVNKNAILALLAGVLTIAMAIPYTLAQSGGSKADPALDEYIQDVRADLKADKVSLIKEAMQSNDRDAAAFWPVYQRYQQEQAELDDDRVRVVRNYSDKWMKLTDAEAKELAQMSLELESRRAELRRKYFGEFNQVLPGLTVAKFFQLEHRLDLLVDLRIASELPALLVRQSTTANDGSQKVPK